MKRFVAFLVLCAISTIATAVDYAVTVSRVKDGDTLDVNVEVWPDISVMVTVRLDKINTPESRGAHIPACEIEAGMKAKAFTTDFVSRGAVVISIRKHEDKYGRTLADVRVDGKDLGAALIAAKLAKPYYGEKRGPWCVDVDKKTPAI